MAEASNTNTAAEEATRPARPASIANFDLKHLSAEFLDDPYPTYRALREFDPIHRMSDGSYFLTRYDDCLAVYRDPQTWSSDKKLDFRPNFAESLLYEHHTTSWCSTIRPITRACASCSRPPSRRAHSLLCKAEWKRWSSTCSKPPRKKARAISSVTSPPRSRLR
jgi:cytochrome P450